MVVAPFGERGCVLRERLKKERVRIDGEVFPKIREVRFERMKEDVPRFRTIWMWNQVL